MVGFVVTADRQGRAVKMPVRSDPRTGRCYFRVTVKTTPNGEPVRLFGTPGVPGPYQDLSPNEAGARGAAQRAIAQVVAAAAQPEHPTIVKEEVPTFGVWFKGRFWREWVVAQKNKPTEVRAKESIYD